MSRLDLRILRLLMLQASWALFEVESIVTMGLPSVLDTTSIRLPPA